MRTVARGRWAATGLRRAALEGCPPSLSCSCCSRPANQGQHGQRRVRATRQDVWATCRTYLGLARFIWVIKLGSEGACSTSAARRGVSCTSLPACRCANSFRLPGPGPGRRSEQSVGCCSAAWLDSFPRGVAEYAADFCATEESGSTSEILGILGTESTRPTWPSHEYAVRLASATSCSNGERRFC